MPAWIGKASKVALAVIALGLVLWMYWKGVSLAPGVGFVLAAMAVLVERGRVRENKMPGLVGSENYSFSWGPVFADLGRAIAAALAGFVFLIAFTRRVPDTPFGMVVLLVPTFGLLGWGLYFLWRARTKAVYGVRQSNLPG